MHDIAVLTYDAGTALGLRFRIASTIEAIEIIGAGDVTESTIAIVTPQPGAEVHYTLPGSFSLTEYELAAERAIHGLEDDWISSRVNDLLLHQRRQSRGQLEISALVALAVLQERLNAPLIYLGEQYTVEIDNEHAAILDPNTHNRIEAGSYVCGTALTSAFLEKHGGAVKRLTFAEAGIELVPSVAQYLRGLDHLFALAMGGAIFSSLTSEVRA